jgi:hypothetical protein
MPAAFLSLAVWAAQAAEIDALIRQLGEFPAGGITTLVFRAGRAKSAKVTVVSQKNVIRIEGTPSGGAKGYHSADPNWRETPPSQWGLDSSPSVSAILWSSQRAMKLASCITTTGYADLGVSAPTGVKVVLEDRTLTGDGAADLRDPAAPPQRPEVKRNETPNG